jgi:hypothetical protein
MKIRNGFVSNSSSSSFVVKYRDSNWVSKKDGEHKFLLTKKQLNTLKKYGFKYSSLNNPYFVGTVIEKKKPNLKSFDKWDDINLTYDLTCNQDDVIYFLLTNKIPFVALCHYEQKLVIWDGLTEWFYEMPNMVEHFSKKIGVDTFGSGKLNSLFEPLSYCPKHKTIKIKEWIENETKFGYPIT